MNVIKTLLLTGLFVTPFVTPFATSFATPLAFACELSNGKQLTAGDVALSYKILEDSVSVSQPFSMEIKLCKNGEAITPKRLRVNAIMPAHGHGMNYQPSIQEIDVGHYQVDDFVFHMMGDWAFIIDVFMDNEKPSFTIDYML